MTTRLVNRLRALEVLREQVAQLDQALGQLTPSERLIIQKTVLEPGRNHVKVLCQLLDVEVATVYRRREKALKKLEQLLYSDPLVSS